MTDITDIENLETPIMVSLHNLRDWHMRSAAESDRTDDSEAMHMAFAAVVHGAITSIENNRKTVIYLNRVATKRFK